MTDYHDKAGYSSSELKAMARGEKAWESEYWLKNKNYGNAFALGSAMHMAILEPDLFAKKYVYNPNIKFNTKAGKAWKQAQEGDGKIILSTTDTDTIQNAVRATKTNTFDEYPFNLSKNLYEFFNEKCVNEEEFVIKDFELEPGLRRTVKVKPDAYFTTEETVFIFDPKSCKQSDFNYRKNAITRYMYSVQAIWYANILKRVLKKKNAIFYFIWIEKGAEGNIAITPYNNKQLEDYWYVCCDLIRKIEERG